MIRPELLVLWDEVLEGVTIRTVAERHGINYSRLSDRFRHAGLRFSPAEQWRRRNVLGPQTRRANKMQRSGDIKRHERDCAFIAHAVALSEYLQRRYIRAFEESTR